MVLKLEDVRSLAAFDNYKEIQHNSTSRVIIFRNPSGSTQVNVYYTTGTVGTCLNHPKQGKTQLFRRGVVNLDMLAEIFQNPRIHTGVGYKLRKNMNMWRPTADTENSSSNELIYQDQEPKAECDLVRRWRYVCAALNLGKSLSSQRVDNAGGDNINDDDNDDEARILLFCKLWNALEFPASVDSSQVKNRRTGATCTLLSLLLATAKRYHRVGYVYDRRDGMEPREISIDQAIKCICEEGDQFTSEYSSELSQVKTLLGEFSSSEVREELLIWFFGKMSPGDHFIRIPVEEEDHDNYAATGLPISEFLHNRKEINETHCEYSELYYPKKSGLCQCHGVM
jgi:hypothetical protein